MSKHDHHVNSVLLVGCGKMGQALLEGWLKAGLATHVHVIDPAPASRMTAGNIAWHESAADYLASSPPMPDAIVLAVKPQMMDAICAPLASFAPSALVVSIAAGLSLASYERIFGAGRAVVRAMPNTPAAIGMGVTAAVAGRHVTTNQAGIADALLRVTGDLIWIEQEYDLDAITAVSGSGPAYVFLLIETLAKAGEAEGLSGEAAMRLARLTVIGAAALAGVEKSTDARTLRKNVTSPGGTTEAALGVLMSDTGLQRLMTDAIAAATKRSRDLRS